MNKWATERMAIEEGRRKEEKRRREEKWREEEERERLAEEEARIQGMEIGRAKLESLFSRWELKPTTYTWIYHKSKSSKMNQLQYFIWSGTIHFMMNPRKSKKRRGSMQYLLKFVDIC